MNRGLTLADGHFVCHLDDDDEIVHTRIERMVRAAQTSRAEFLWHRFSWEVGDGQWKTLGGEEPLIRTITTGSIFYHRVLTSIPWDVRGAPAGRARGLAPRAPHPRRRAGAASSCPPCSRSTTTGVARPTSPRSPARSSWTTPSDPMISVHMTTACRYRSGLLEARGRLGVEPELPRPRADHLRRRQPRRHRGLPRRGRGARRVCACHPQRAQRQQRRDPRSDAACRPPTRPDPSSRGCSTTAGSVPAWFA